MNPFAHPEVRETRGRPLSGEPVGRASICARRVVTSCASRGWTVPEPTPRIQLRLPPAPLRASGNTLCAVGGEVDRTKLSHIGPARSRQLTRERNTPSPIAVGPTGRNRSRRPIDPTIHPAGGSSLSSLAPHATGGVMAGWQARRHVCPRARSGASDPVLNVPPYLAGGFALPATFQTLHDPHRSVSELRPHRLPSVAPNRNHGAPGQCVPTSRTNQP